MTGLVLEGIALIRLSKVTKAFQRGQPFLPKFSAASLIVGFILRTEITLKLHFLVSRTCLKEFNRFACVLCLIS